MSHYAATTEQITVSVHPVYLDDQSDVFAGRFVFAYFIRIENRSDIEVQLLRRHWVIRHESSPAHAGGRTTEVEGEGVIGQQPVIVPGRVHTYNSFCVLETMAGTMEGTYLMQRPNGSRFRAEIPLFHLRAAAN